MSESFFADWRIVSLSELGEVNRGRSRHRPRNDASLYGGPYPFVQTGDVTASDGRISTYSQTYSDVGLAQSRLWPAGTMCITIAANIAETGVLQFPACFPDSVVGFVPDPKYADVYFVEYMFRQLKRDIQRQATGSVQDNINLATLARLTFPLPPLPEQRAIAEVLGALDDKIAANTKLARASDELSQAVFRSISVGPAHVPLSTTAQFVNGKAFTKGASGAGRVVIRIAELNSGIGGSTVFSDAEVGDDFVARQGDILFAWSGSLTLHRWFRSEGIVNQHIFKVIPSGYPSWLVYELLRERLAYFKGIAADKATTMGHIQRRHLDELVAVPSPASIDRVDELMTSLWDRALLAEQENESLAATRDALLPQLMSGTLRVRDAEKLVEEVA